MCTLYTILYTRSIIHNFFLHREIGFKFNFCSYVNVNTQYYVVVLIDSITL